jgi:HEAT repeat protein
MVCARVCAAHELRVPEQLAALCDDENWRVRDAAVTALGLVGEGEHAEAMRALLDDENATVRERSERALARMAERLDRPLDD